MDLRPVAPDSDRDPSLFRLGDRLTVVLGFSELLLAGSYGPLSDEQRRVLEIVTADCRDAGDLFHDLIQRGLGRISPAPPKPPGG